MRRATTLRRFGNALHHPVGTSADQGLQPRSTMRAGRSAYASCSVRLNKPAPCQSWNSRDLPRRFQTRNSVAFSDFLLSSRTQYVSIQTY